ncbi:mitochondrial hydrolase YKR070W-like isoform X2 [Silene latifolia]|uniref:mitochondrial hydrolase YKR070W-like isoform X2 n=1 Tax=Silene latifolia TaxID=37657 RepID=UPI003D77A0DA
MLGIVKKLLVEEERRKGYLWRSFSRIAAAAAASNPGFGIAFDIDGVLLRGNAPIGGSPRALSKLYNPQGCLKIPYVFLTNGGGVRESIRAAQLTKLFAINVLPSQVLHGHSPFKQLANRFQNDFVVAVGKGEPAAVLSEYGFKNVISIDDYALCFDHIDPLAPHKKWRVDQTSDQGISFPSAARKKYVSSNRVQAVFIVSDSVDWSRDIQVLCDILRTGGLPGGEPGTQPHLYFAHDDLKYQGAFPTERFGMGAFRISLQSVYNSIHPHPLQYSALGKPNPLAFKNAEMALRELCTHEFSGQHLSGYNPFKTLYMIGDNPSVDIKGAHQAGHPWFSILTRTGVFRGERQDHEFQADMVVDTVEEAVEFILDKEKVN